MKLIIATDAWSPQVNGVVRTYQNILPYFDDQGVQCTVLHPYLDGFKRARLKSYPEIEYVINLRAVYRELENSLDSETVVHIATEGPIGLATKIYCDRVNIPVTTGFHTMFPEFIQRKYKVPKFITYPYFQWFHKNSKAILCPTKSIAEHLNKKHMLNTAVWTRGVDQNLFSPKFKNSSCDGYILCVSRVSEEKGLDDFCKLQYHNKVLVGDGPYLKTLKRRYPDVRFVGKQEGTALAEWYANADCFVFPSKTDTFGIVILEAIASGVPVAAYPEPGPVEVIQCGINGYIDENLQVALDSSLSLTKTKIQETAEKWTWQYSTQQFFDIVNSASSR